MAPLSFVLEGPSEFSLLKLLCFIYLAPITHTLIYGFKHGNFLLQYCSRLSIFNRKQIKITKCYISFEGTCDLYDVLTG